MEEKITLDEYIAHIKEILNTIRDSEDGVRIHSWTASLWGKAEVNYLLSIGAIYKDDWSNGDGENYYKIDPLFV